MSRTRPAPLDGSNQALVSERFPSRCVGHGPERKPRYCGRDWSAERFWRVTNVSYESRALCLFLAYPRQVPQNSNVPTNHKRELDQSGPLEMGIITSSPSQPIQHHQHKM